MEKKKMDDPLPEGWIVTFTVRKDGTKDKYYSFPSTGVTLRSRIDVHRYVNNIPSPSKKKVKAAWGTPKKVVGKKVVEERSPPGWIKTVKAAEMNGQKEGLPPGCIKTVKATEKDGRKEWLPPGWTKTEKVTERDGGKVRIDKYYKSPECTHLFRSMKEVVRYLETGEFGRKRILKQEYKRSNDEDLEDATKTSKVMSFEDKDLTGDISGLGPLELAALQDWEYKFIGKYVKAGTIKCDVPQTNESSSGEPAATVEHDGAKPYY